jgi:hypothetical protein
MTSDFDQAMRRLYVDALEQTGYRAGYFLRLVSELGGLGAAKALLAPGRPTHEGFTTLYMHGRLDLSVEATVLANPEFAILFSEDELHTARERLALHRYQPSS